MSDYQPPRVINFHPTREYMDNVQENVNNNELRNVLGYLMMWDHPNYDIVDIYTDAPFDFVAIYKDTENVRTFIIGAIWREAEHKYTTHS